MRYGIEIVTFLYLSKILLIYTIYFKLPDSHRFQAQTETKLFGLLNTHASFVQPEIRNASTWRTRKIGYDSDSETPECMGFQISTFKFITGGGRGRLNSVREFSSSELNVEC